MPRNSIGQYSTTPGDNTDIGGINIAEGMLPSDVNNAMRELLSQLKEFQTGAGGDTISPPVLIATTATVGTLKATSTATFDSAVILSSDATLRGQSDLRFADSDSSNWVAFQAPATVASNVTWTLPAADGTSGQVLSTNGSGTLSWASGGGSLTGATDSASPFETSLGSGAGAVNTGVNNTFVGFEAGNDNTTGANNTAVGYQALDALTTATRATAVGANAGGALETAGQFVGVGFDAGAACTTGGENTLVGDSAGAGVTTGYNNVMIGTQAGEYTTATTTGSRNIFIGAYAKGSGATVNDETVIGRNKAGKGADTGFIGSGSGVFQGNNSSSWSTTSDQRIKKNIVENTEGLEIIGQLRVCNFEYRLPEEITDLPEHAAVKKTGVQLGVIAQELQQVCPDCVTEQSTGVLSVDTDEIFWHMVNAIKELSAKCDSLQAEVNTLKGQ